MLFAAAGGVDYALVEVYGRPAPGNHSSVDARIAGARALRELPRPDMSALMAACPEGINGVIVVVQGWFGGAPGGHPYRCISRFFGPWMGIDEDAVTGSAHAVLGPYIDPDGDEGWWWARQASPRGGDLRVRYDHTMGRVDVAGEATTVVRGEIELPDEQEE